MTSEQRELFRRAANLLLEASDILTKILEQPQAPKIRVVPPVKD